MKLFAQGYHTLKDLATKGHPHCLKEDIGRPLEPYKDMAKWSIKQASTYPQSTTFTLLPKTSPPFHI